MKPNLIQADRAQAYREFLEWAKRTIADSIMRHGFTQLGSAVETVVRVYWQDKAKWGD